MRGPSSFPANVCGPGPGRRRTRQRGAALLLAMMILVLVVTLTAGMVWQQARAVEVEAAERARAQSAWILNGALDWARLILAEDQRTGSQREQDFDSLDEPWATPLAEARLSTFLAADRDNNVDSGPEAFLSGAIVDAQSRYNLRNLADPVGKLVPEEIEAFARLVRAAGLPDGTADTVAALLAPVWAPQTEGSAGVSRPLAPGRIADLVWLGLDPATVQALRPWTELLPARTPVNANTAPREVLVAAIDGLDLGGAERLVQARQRQPLRSLDAIRELLGEGPNLVPERVGVKSQYFEIMGRLRLEDRVLEERSLVLRNPGDRGGGVTVLRRTRESLPAPGSGP